MVRRSKFILNINLAWAAACAAVSLSLFAQAHTASAQQVECTPENPYYPDCMQNPHHARGVHPFLRRVRARRFYHHLRWRFRPQMNGRFLPGAPAGLRRAGITPAAGNGEGPLGDGWTAWMTDSYSWIKDKRPASAARGGSLSLTAGLDKQLTETLTAGISLNGVRSRMTTRFNGGYSHVNGLTVSPYVNITLAEWLSAEITGGYVYNRERLYRTVFAPASGRRHSNGYMFSASLDASKWYGSWLLSAHGGVVATRDKWSAYRESGGTPNAAETNRLVQGIVEGTASWWLEPVMPYVTVSYARDLSRNDPQGGDRDDWTFTGGLAWYGSGRLDGLTADFSASVVAGRARQRNATVSFGLRWNF